MRRQPTRTDFAARIFLLGLLTLFAVACSSTADSAGIRLVSPTQGESFQAGAGDNLVVLDVRTSEEFSEGHIEGAIMLDFYSPTFAVDLAALDRDVPYLLYCRSGNRSAQASQIMATLGFADVAEVDGGIVAWSNAGLPLVR